MRKNELIYCACGCGKKLLKYHPKYGYERKYVFNHHHIGKPFPNKGFRKPVKKEILERMYLKEKKKVSEIAVLLNLSRTSLGRQFKYYGIPILTRPERRGEEKRDRTLLVDCACGCGEKIKKYDKHGTERKFSIGHNPTRPKRRYKVRCAWCKKEYGIKLSQLKQAKMHFCSRECVGKWQSRHRVGENNLLWTSKKIKCAYCGKIMVRQFNQFQRFKHSFCNQRCKSMWQKENMKGKNNPSWKGGRKEMECGNCGKKIWIKLYDFRKSKRHFCSMKCRIEAVSRENRQFWIDGKFKKRYPLEFNEKFKNYIRAFDNYKCQKCGAPQEEFNEALSVHHINYNKEDNRVENCITLCKYCNSEVNFDREFWKIFFQELRREKLEGLKELENVHQKNK